MLLALILLLPGLLLFSRGAALAADSQCVLLGGIEVKKGVDALALAPNTGVAYGINREAKALYVLDLVNYSIKNTLKLERAPVSIAVNPLDGRAYITARDNEDKGLLYIADPAGGLSEVELPRDPQGIAIDGAGGRIFIALEKDKQLLILSLTDYKQIGLLPLPHRPRAISLDADSGRAVLTLGEAEGEGKQSRIIVLSTATGKGLFSLDAKDEVLSLSFDPEADTALAVTKRKTLVIDINKGQAIEADLAGGGASDINPSTHTAFITAASGQGNPSSAIRDFILYDIIARESISYTLGSETLTAAAIDRYRNTVLIGAKDKVLELQLPNPAPSITNLIPAYKRIGDPQTPLTLKVEGDRFIATSSVKFDGSSVSTTFKDNTNLEASIPDELVSEAGTKPVTVTNPAPGGGTSAPYPFKVKNPLPVLLALSPTEAPAGGGDFELWAAGKYFMPDYAVNFNGTDLETTYISSTELSALVLSALIQSPGGYLVAVITPERESSNYLPFSVTESRPEITEVSPPSGAPGTVVSIKGTNLVVPETPSTKVYIGDKRMTVLSVVPTLIKAIVPTGAVTGNLKVETPIGSDEGPVFTVTEDEGFELYAEPEAVSIPSGGRASVVVAINNTGQRPFSGLVGLSVPELPSGITVSFNPEYISSNQSSVMTVNMDVTVTEAAVLTINGHGWVSGVEVGGSAEVGVEPIPAGVTTVSGRVVASKDQKPIKNVTLKLAEQTAVTDAAGNFYFKDVPSGEMVLMIDGDTADTAEASYPSRIAVPVTIIGGIDNTLPYFIYLNAVNTKHFTPIVSTTEDVKVTDPEVPDFEMTIPKGVSIIGWDGLPNEKMSVQIVPRDRLPIPPPPDDLLVQTVFMFYFGKPGGGYPSEPIPVKVPNQLGSEPGEKYDLYYYDESPTPDPNSNQWKKFGTGTVTDDGRQVASDPGFGIPKFCCGAYYVVINLLPIPNRNPDSNTPGGADPVDLATGLFVLEKTDMALPGRMPLSIRRVYRNMDYTDGPFGIGATHSYDSRLTVSATEQRMTYMVPDGGKFFFFKEEDGSFRNTGSETMYGSAAYLNQDGSRGLRFKDGTVHRFDSSGRLSEIEDTNGNRVKIIRDGGGKITEIEEPAGRKFYFSYDGSGRIAYIQDPLRRTVQYSYDNEGRLRTVTDPAGGQTTYTYDYRHNMLSITDARGITFLSNVFDGGNRVIKQTAADGGEYDIRYFTPSEPMRYFPSLPGGGKSFVNGVCTERYPVYLREGESPPPGECVITINIPSKEVPPKEPEPLPPTPPPTPPPPPPPTINQTLVLDPYNNGMSYRFDGQGYLLAVEDGLGRKFSYERKMGSNQLLSVTDPIGRITSFAYDSNGNRTSVTDPEGNITRYEYDPVFNKPTKITDAMGNITAMAYDDKGNLISVTDPMGNITAFTYNQYGQPVSITDAMGNVSSFEYDTYGNLSVVIDPLGNRTKRTYDRSSRLIAAMDANGWTTSYVYDALNRVIATTDPLGAKTSFTYDPNGNLLTVTDAKGHTISYTYDVMDRVASMTDQLGRTEHYEYDLLGNLVKFTDRKGQVTENAYNVLNRPSERKYADGSITKYDYDGAGRITVINDTQGGLITQSYDMLDRVIKETTEQGSISYAYDVLGRRTSMTVAGQETVNYTYDANSSMINISSALQSQILNFGLSYDETGRRTALSYPNGVTTGYSYDSASRLLSLEHLNPLNALLEKVSYAYDPNGNRTSVDRLNAPVKFPTPVNNITYNQANQMTSFNGESLSYDLNGNLIQKGGTFYQWNARNQLVGINGPNMTASFKYNALGRRIEKTINGKTTQFLYDGLDIAQEIENGIVTTNYLRGLNIDEALGILRQDSTYYYLTDALGSTLALTDSSGAVAAEYYYDSFGNTETSNPEIYNPIQFTGRENDGTGLIYYRARYYSPELQRFISEDPIGLSGGINKFVYASNNPTNRIDPLGLTWSSNWNFLLDFLAGGGSNNRFYGPNTTETREMQNSPGAEALRNDFYTHGDRRGFNYSTGQALWDTVLNPATADWSSTAAQVGGFAGATAINNGDGTVTFTIPNTAGAHSFFYHAVPNRPGNIGPMTNINQTFQWTEPIRPPALRRPATNSQPGGRK